MPINFGKPEEIQNALGKNLISNHNFEQGSTNWISSTNYSFSNDLMIVSGFPTTTFGGQNVQTIPGGHNVLTLMRCRRNGSQVLPRSFNLYRFSNRTGRFIVITPDISNNFEIYSDLTLEENSTSRVFFGGSGDGLFTSSTLDIDWILIFDLTQLKNDGIIKEETEEAFYDVFAISEAGEVSGEIKKQITKIYKGENIINKVFRGTTLLFSRFLPIQATGGTISDVNIDGVNYRIHAFTSTGTSTFNVTDAGTNPEVDVLIVAGGGGGGAAASNQRAGGGGGAGGLLQGHTVVTSQSYAVVVGSGGAGGQSTNANGQQGGNSSALSFVAVGGGFGSGASSSGTPSNGGAGGSGGGAGGGIGVAGGGAGTSGQGFAGGNNDESNRTASGGGGGAGGVGGNAQSSNIGGAAGPGLSLDITGTATVYASGGKGRTASTSGSPGSNGVANTGNGATGGRGQGDRGGDGGSGIVIIRYPLEEI